MKYKKGMILQYKLGKHLIEIVDEKPNFFCCGNFGKKKYVMNKMTLDSHYLIIDNKFAKLLWSENEKN